MKVAILAGGFGTRLSEETVLKPKPMVEIAGQPILLHIMKYYSAFGFNEFVIALGYKGEIIKDFFVNYYFQSRDLTVSLKSGKIKTHPLGKNSEDWTVHLIDTGLRTQTGGRVKQIIDFIGNERFMLTYGDGLANVDIDKLLQLHLQKGRLATITAVRPPARFGEIIFNEDDVISFQEKPQTGEGWINGGFFVLEPGVADYIEGDQTVFERSPIERLAKDEQLVAYRHHDFWQSMDTLRDVQLLEDLWKTDRAPWKIWS